MATSQDPQKKQAANELRGIGKNYQGAAIRWRDYPSDITSEGNAAYHEIILTCGFRLFIMGVEVTPHIIGSVNPDRHGRDGVNSLSFTLDNNFSKFVYTNWNLGGDIELDNAYYGNLIKSSGAIELNNMVRKLDAKVTSNMKMEAIPDASKLNWYIPDYSGKDKYVFDEIPKRDLFSYKSKLGIKTTATGGAYKSRYDLTPGACAINLMDHVRYFIMDPNEDNLSLEDTMWKPEYTGFVTSASITENPITGESSISVTCHDIRHVMRKMRYMTNLNDASVLSSLITFSDQDEVQDGAGLFNDLFVAASNPTWATTLSDCTADTVIRAITLGDDIQALSADKGKSSRVAETEAAQNAKYPQNKESVSSKTLHTQYATKLKEVQNKKKTETGSKFSPVGSFTLGLYKGYDPPTAEDNSEQIAKLEEWMDLLNFGIARQWLSYGTVTMIGMMTRPSMGDKLGATDDQSPFSAFNGFVHIMCPSGGLSVSNIWDRVFVTFDGSPTMSNRMEVIEQMCNTIDYQIQVNTMGDLAFEFPMYDFYPEEFGKYKYTMAWSDSIKHHEHNDEGDGNPVTGLRVYGQYKSDDAVNEDDEWLKHNLFSVFIKSDYLASKYGVVVEEFAIPWAANAWGVGTGGAQSGETEAPSENQDKVGALASFGIIEFTKRLAKMSSMSMNGIYCPFLWPNKPMLNRDLRRIGTVTSVNSGMQVNGICTTGISCEYIRKADTDGNFLNICGAKNTPFSYASRAGLALFPNKAAVKADSEKPFSQNGELIYTLDNGFGIEIIQPSETMMANLFQKFGVNGVTATLNSASGPVSKHTWSDPQKCYNKFRTLPIAQQDRLNAMANRLCHGTGSLRGWQIYQYMLSESGYKPDQPNIGGGATGATGLIQFMPSTLIGMANAGNLPGAPKGLTPNNKQDRLVMNNWFRNSAYCVGPNATMMQLDLTEKYFSMNAKGGIYDVANLNRAVFMPGANTDPNMSFSDPRQPKAVQKIAAQTRQQNGGVDSLAAMIRFKGISTDPPPSDAALEQARLSGTKAAKSAAATTSQVPSVPANAAPAVLKTPTTGSGSTLYVASVKAPKPKANENIIDRTVSSLADPIFNSLGSGITSGVNNYATSAVSDSGADKAFTSVKKVTSDVTQTAMQGTLEQIDSSASNVKVWGFNPLAGGIGASSKPGLKIGN